LTQVASGKFDFEQLEPLVLAPKPGLGDSDDEK
jgi:hypothetical protein